MAGRVLVMFPNPLALPKVCASKWQIMYDMICNLLAHPGICGIYVCQNVYKEIANHTLHNAKNIVHGGK